MIPPKTPESSFESSHQWYSNLVGKEGHYYHQKVILPALLFLMNLKNPEKKALLDLGCGQGILERHLPKKLNYTGIDLSASLIQEAQRLCKNPSRHFLVSDITEELPIKKHFFDFVVLLLSLQNLENGEKAIQNAALHLKNHGELLIVLNHPAFRIPRQSAWHFNEKSRLFSREVMSYLSSMKIPIQTAPSKNHFSPTTHSYHHPLSTYSQWLKKNHFFIEELQELVSDKVSTGSRARAENRIRKEIPLFLILKARKIIF
ncbi:MAG: class I SAM-dependent methyltransferase [Parachlamydiales bacterium]|jgi:SAM-dependent methyltransferase